MNKQNKGITLVALVITIIILIILAGVSISILFSENGLINRAKQGASEYKTESIKERLTLALVNLKTNDDPTINEPNLRNVLDIEFGEGGYILQEIDDEFFITIEGETFSISEDGVISSEETFNPENQVYPEYTMGQKITLLGEDYYVIEDSDSTVATVKLLAAIPIELTQYRQTAIRPAYPRYDDNSGSYEGSEIKGLVDSYKSALEARMHKTLTEARLLNTSEAREMNLAGYTDIVYGSPTRWNYWIYNPSNEGTSSQEAIWGSRPGNGTDNVNRYDHVLRPVIVIKKRYISKISTENDFPVYAEYTMGQEVTIGTGDNAELYYVVENSESALSTVKLLAALPIELTNYKQSTSPGYPRYDDNSGNYEGSEIKVLVDDYKAALETRIGKNVVEARLITASETRAMNIAGYTDIVYGSPTRWNYWIYNPSNEGTSFQEAIWGSRPGNGTDNVDRYDHVLRPLIVMNKTDIQ